MTFILNLVRMIIFIFIVQIISTGWSETIIIILALPLNGYNYEVCYHAQLSVLKL